MQFRVLHLLRIVLRITITIVFLENVTNYIKTTLFLNVTNTSITFQLYKNIKMLVKQRL